jgi:hypothetical protein
MLRRMLAQQVTESAPWWGVAVIAGAALLLGGIISQLGSIAVDWRKAKRERSETSRAALLAACAQFNAEVSKFRLAVTGGDVGDAYALHITESNLELMAPSAIGLAALHLASMTVKYEPDDKVDLVKHNEAWALARSVFLEAARKELGQAPLITKGTKVPW